MKKGLAESHQGMTLLSVKDLKKQYGRAMALAGVSLQVHAGDIYGFLGRNGAGKSTTIKILAGLVRPDQGEVSFFGSASAHPDHMIRKRVGFLIENPSFLPTLNAVENLCCHQILRGRSGPHALQEVRQILERVGLSDVAHRKVGGYSTGMRQRLGLAQAFLGMPEIVVLDEPLNGLDPEGIYSMRKMILEMAAERGTTFFISSHILAEVEQMCNRLGFVAHGKVVAEGSLDELGATGWLLIRVAQHIEALQTIGMQWPQSEPHLTEDRRIALRLDDNKHPELIRFLVAKGYDLYEVMRKPRSLEETFMTLTTDRAEGTGQCAEEESRSDPHPLTHDDGSAP
ncbi:MAG: ABC transporter ATP-binding protein [Planctomycetota bacterium]